MHNNFSLIRSLFFSLSFAGDDENVRRRAYMYLRIYTERNEGLSTAAAAAVLLLLPSSSSSSTLVFLSSNRFDLRSSRRCRFAAKH